MGGPSDYEGRIGRTEVGWGMEVEEDGYRRYKLQYDRIKYRIVRQGVPLLDHRVARWRSRTSEQLLDLEDHTACVVGQLFPRYWEAIRDLSGLRTTAELHGWSVRHGFDVNPGEDYQILDRAWRNELGRETTKGTVREGSDRVR